MNQREGKIILVGTHLGVWEEHVDEKDMAKVLRGLLGHLRGRGWSVERDPHVIKHSPSLAPLWWVGRKGDLEFHAGLSGRHLEVGLFQSLNVDNPNGGRYDFDEFTRMPRHMRLPCIVELAAIVRSLVAKHGYTLTRGFDLTPPDMPLLFRVLRACEGEYRPGRAAENPLRSFNEKWGADRFVRDETGWPALSEYDRYGQNVDRDKRPLRNGETRYFRDYHGHLQRATVYTNMNSMWMVVYGGSVTYVGGWELFSCERPDLEPRRVMRKGAERLRAVFDAAVKAEDFAAVARLAKVLQRVAPPARGLRRGGQGRGLRRGGAAREGAATGRSAREEGCLILAMNRTGCHECHGRLPLCEACVASQVEAIHVAHLVSGLDGANCPRCQSAKHHNRRDRRRSLGRRA